MVDQEIKSELLDLVMEGVLSIERKTNGEITFKVTEGGKAAIEKWILEEHDDAS